MCARTQASPEGRKVGRKRRRKRKKKEEKKEKRKREKKERRKGKEGRKRKECAHIVYAVFIFEYLLWLLFFDTIL